MYPDQTSRLTTRNSPGFALVVTLIMVVLAAIIVIALLSSASLDRVTAKSTDDRYQAEIAAQNALEAAKKALIGSPSAATSITAEDTFLVVRSNGAQSHAAGTKDAYYFLAKPQAGAAKKVDCYPLFAGGTTSSVTIDFANTPPFKAPAAPAAPFGSNPAQQTFGTTTTVYPTLLSHQQPAYTQWQEIKDPADTASAPNHNLPYQRYTFWAEDLAGLVDASVAGNQLAAGSHKRANGTNPNEIALFTVFDSSLSSDSGTTQAKDLIDNRTRLFTPLTLTQVAPPAAGKIDRTQETLAVRMGLDPGGERNLIPLGFGFPDEGKSKTNLNSLITDATKSDQDKVIALAKVINDNLPNFATLRKGGLATGLATTEDYVKTIAAGMIAYATAQPVVGADYRGIGLHPFVVEFYERFTWEKNGPDNFYFKNGTYWVDVKAVGYAQLWNMTNRDITSGTLTISDINRYYAYAGGSSDSHKFDDAFGTGDIVFDATNPLAANQFKVVKVYEHLYNFDTGLAVKPLTNTSTMAKLGSEASVAADPSTCGYVVKWNGKIVDRAGAGTLDGARGDGSDSFPGLNYIGLERTKVTLVTPNSQPNPSWRGTLPGLRYELPTSFGESIYNLGDPRSAYYIQIEQADVSFAVQSAWGGRMYQNGLVNQANPWKAAETAVASWPDGGHSTTKGTLPTNTSTDPTTIATVAFETTKPPAIFASSGKYTSVTELSRIYDPIQWQPAGFPPSSRTEFETKWRDAWKTNMIPDANYGCASTLHIGSPEFKNFDTIEARASRLLDLFAVSDRRDVRGLINLNTASRETLRALAAGIEMKDDPAIVPASVFGPVTDPAAPVQADKFADAVISNRPFLSTAQLADIRSDLADTTSKFFGNTAQWVSNGPTEWNDAAREEYFARLFELTTTRSRNFRVFVTGQSLDKNGKVLATVNRVFHAFIKPTRAPTGNVTSQQIEITYEKDL